MLKDLEQELNELIGSHETFSKFSISHVILSEIPSLAHQMQKYVHVTCDINISNIVQSDIASFSVFMFAYLVQAGFSEVGYEILYRFLWKGQAYTIFKISLPLTSAEKIQEINLSNIFDRSPIKGVTTSLYLKNISKCLDQARAKNLN